MVKYRPHRGMLSESIDGAKEFDTIDQMYDYILNDWNAGYDFFDREDLSISEETRESTGKNCGMYVLKGLEKIYMMYLNVLGIAA